MSGEDAPPRPRTRVDLEIRFRIQDGLAQFNRSDLVESSADAVLADFVRTCERMLAGERGAKWRERERPRAAVADDQDKARSLSGPWALPAPCRERARFLQHFVEGLRW